VIFEILAFILFGLATFDTFLTSRRIRTYGKWVELNGLIRRLVKWFGPEAGSILGILGPTLLWVLCAKAFNATWLVALLVGLRARFCWIQLESLVFEKALRQYIKEHKMDIKAGDATVGLPSTHSDVDTSHSSPSPAQISKDK
jgi:hypothetical protein